MKKVNIKRLFLAIIFVVSLALTFSSCKSQHHCPAYSQINVVDINQNS